MAHEVGYKIVGDDIQAVEVELDPGEVIRAEVGAMLYMEDGIEMQTGTDGYLCSAEGIKINVEFTKKIGVGLFGGEGFILQRLSGDGYAFVHAGGAIIKRELQHSEIIKVDTGCLVAFSPSVNYDIQFIGGFKNVLFGGEGLFYAKLTGPGIVYLQTLPFSRLADRIVTAANWGGRKEESRGLGGLLGGIISGKE